MLRMSCVSDVLRGCDDGVTKEETAAVEFSLKGAFTSVISAHLTSSDRTSTHLHASGSWAVHGYRRSVHGICDCVYPQSKRKTTWAMNIKLGKQLANNYNKLTYLLNMQCNHLLGMMSRGQRSRWRAYQRRCRRV